MREKQCISWYNSGTIMAGTYRDELISLETRDDPYTLSRGAESYIRELQGVDYFFDYVSTVQRGIADMLEIGIGKGIAAREFMEEGIMRNIRLSATGLIDYPRELGRSGLHRFALTDAEDLGMLPEQMFAGVIGVYSIAYSEHPEIAMQEVDRVLMPGGAVKFKFPPHTTHVGRGTSVVFKNHEMFSRQAMDLGYSVALDGAAAPTVLLAIKPGMRQGMTASRLLELDRQNMQTQLEVLQFGEHPLKKELRKALRRFELG
jgi:SAM-dependent methyltransferase